MAEESRSPGETDKTSAGKSCVWRICLPSPCQYKRYFNEDFATQCYVLRSFILCAGIHAGIGPRRPCSALSKTRSLRPTLGDKFRAAGQNPLKHGLKMHEFRF